MDRPRQAAGGRFFLLMPAPPAQSEHGGWPDREQGLGSAAAAAGAPPRRARVHHTAFPHQRPPGAPSGPRGLGALMNSSPGPFSPHGLSLTGDRPCYAASPPESHGSCLIFYFPSDKAEFTSKRVHSGRKTEANSTLDTNLPCVLKLPASPVIRSENEPSS